MGWASLSSIRKATIIPFSSLTNEAQVCPLSSSSTLDQHQGHAVIGWGCVFLLLVRNF